MKKITVILWMSVNLLMLYSCGDSTSSYKSVRDVDETHAGETISDGYSVEYKSELGVKKVHVKLNDVASFDALLDTGCNFDMVISLQEMQNLIKANTLSEHDIVDSVITTLANGELYKYMVLKIREVSIVDTKGQQHKLSNIRATVMPNPAAPLLLGNGIIDQLAKSSYTVNLQNNEIRFD